jgi:hypothetical protein
MRRRLLTLLVVLAVGAVAAPAAAITHGAPDASAHPYVGMMFFYVPDEIDPRFPDPGAWFSCSGTLMSPTVFLTAGHCAYGVGLNGTPATSGGNDVWITFEQADSLRGLPSSTDYIGLPNGNQQRYDARVGWFAGSDKWTRGTAYPHPAYGLGFPDTSDVGIVRLSHPVVMTEYGVLPEPGYLDGLATQRGLQKASLLVQTVGYGMLEVKPFYNDNLEDERYQATSKIVNLRSALTGGYNLQTSNSPGNGTGTGGSCFGDSGGPVFAGENSNVVVAIVSFGLNWNCKGADFSFRADIPTTQSFLAEFGVTTP